MLIRKLLQRKLSCLCEDVFKKKQKTSGHVVFLKYSKFSQPVVFAIRVVVNAG